MRLGYRSKSLENAQSYVECIALADKARAELSDTSDTSDTDTMTSSSDAGISADATQANEKRVAQKAHEAVDRAAQTVSSGTDKVMNLQQEYGETAREQIRANPLAVVVLQQWDCM